MESTPSINPLSMDISILDNGRLRLSIQSLSAQERQDLAERSVEIDEMAFLHEVMEPYSTNGGFTPFDAGQANPFVGLTDAPCIAESMNLDDDGKWEIEGRVWWFPDYQVKSLVHDLIERGTVEFAPGNDVEPVTAPTSRKSPTP